MTEVRMGPLSMVATNELDMSVWERLARLYAEIEHCEWDDWTWDDFQGSRLRSFINDELRKKSIDPINYLIIITPERPPEGPVYEAWAPETWWVDIRFIKGRKTDKVGHAPTISEKMRLKEE